MLMALNLAGCAREREAGSLPGFEATQWLGDEQSTGDLPAGASLEHFEAGRREFAIIVDGRVDEVIEMDVASAPNDSWRTVIEGQRAALVREQDGDLLLVQTTDYPNNAVTTFEPPLPLIMAGMEVGQEHASEHAVTVRPLDDPSAMIDRGQATQTLRRRPDQALRLPHDRMDHAAVFERTLVLDLARAKVNETTRAWYVPELGLAAEQSREQVKVLGPLGWTHERLMLRVP
ncbi:MAG: hypothetical protein IT430_16835 [Phycisphaerales bacterium]|nr:hypothetical protein [Phycisphaerales bacterium]